MRKQLLLLLVVGIPSIVCGQTPRQVPPQASERIAKEVRHQLVMLPYLDVFDNIAYQVDGYKVTLTGAVTNPTLKKDAGNVVKSIEGVESVDNKIDVLPPSGMDDALRRKLYVAIYQYSPLFKYSMPVIKPIRIIVKMGRVTLEGVVDSEADKNLVGVRANSVSGIFSVTNNLVVAK